jgi:anti-sigma factor RsiW
MSCSRNEGRILGFIDGRLKENEQREMEKHLAACPACTVRVNEFRAVSGLLEELPQIEPSSAFDVRVRARIAAEPVKQSWWSWFGAAPRVLVAASMLFLATVWVGHKPVDHSSDVANVNANSGDEQQMMQDLPVLENYDVLANFEPLTELSQPDTNDDDQEM